MIISIDKGPDVDTDLLSSEERHILQKLLCWKVMAESLDQFRENTERAFTVGWNNSGPVRRTEVMERVVKQMEKDLLIRLKEQPQREQD